MNTDIVNFMSDRCRNGHLWDLEHDNSCDYCVAVKGYKITANEEK